MARRKKNKNGQRRKGEPRKGDHLTKRQVKRVQGPDPRARFKIFVTVNFDAEHLQRNREAPTLVPVTDWRPETAIRMQLLCPGGNTTNFGFRLICKNNRVNHFNERVNLVVKCPDCPNRYGVLKLNRWVQPGTPIKLNSRTEIGEIECSGFEPVEGHNTLEFMDLFTVNSVIADNTNNTELKIPLGGEVNVEVKNTEGQMVNFGTITGTNVEYYRVV